MRLRAKKIIHPPFMQPVAYQLAGSGRMARMLWRGAFRATYECFACDNVWEKEFTQDDFPCIGAEKHYDDDENEADFVRCEKFCVPCPFCQDRDHAGLVELQFEERT